MHKNVGTSRAEAQVFFVDLGKATKLCEAADAMEGLDDMSPMTYDPSA